MFEKEFTLKLKVEIKVTAESEEEAIEKAHEELCMDGTLDWYIEEGECAICGGEGVVSTDEVDSDGNIERGVGTRKCICQS